MIFSFFFMTMHWIYGWLKLVVTFVWEDFHSLTHTHQHTQSNSDMGHSPAERSSWPLRSKTIFLHCLQVKSHCLLHFAILVCKPIPRDRLQGPDSSLGSRGQQQIQLVSTRHRGPKEPEDWELAGKRAGEGVVGGAVKALIKVRWAGCCSSSGLPLGASKVRQSPRPHRRWCENTWNVTNTNTAPDKVDTDTAAATQNATAFVRKPFQPRWRVKCPSVEARLEEYTG